MHVDGEASLWCRRCCARYVIPVKVVEVSRVDVVVFYVRAGQTIAPRLERVVLFAPRLLSPELANICLEKMRRDPARNADWVTRFHLRNSFGIQEHSIDPGEGFALARTTCLVVYDASYLWLARHLGAELVALDPQHERAVV